MDIIKNINLDLDWKNVKTVYRREFANYFNTPIGYIFLGIFAILVNFLFFFITRFFDRGYSLQGMFDMLKLIYLAFIPVITMRLWAEERRSGTVELLLTLPYSEVELILGKYLSALVFLGLSLATTLFLPILAFYVGAPDFMVLIGSYLGAWLSGSAYIAMGLYISWLTRDQITAFLLSFLACLFIYLLGYQPVLQFFGPMKELLGFLSVSWHSDSLSAGLLDTRDLLYYLSFSALFLYLNKVSIQKFRRGH
ncbi:ABC transporter permease subunit [Turneriella parva]|uniref:ABC-type transport system involved in gliding motility n=1 Tax=Turneriella parva (strain ATCC BAA-1111 / DSM 21527 / NCTC 11395 / H) TaxID=869212 RepID=I4BAK0_TURPD|nr:ABC transporter permease subunit [Turneriella parva]AFM14307.1 ABC-type transport system involved in gliding motility [Turneriella parva DSM 21527]